MSILDPPAEVALRFCRRATETTMQFRERIIAALDEAEIMLPEDFGALLQANVGDDAYMLNVVATAEHGPPEAIFCRRTLH